VSDLERESWLDKRGLAAHLSCSVRSIELAIVDGLPHAIIFGRAKFRASEVEAWLQATGRLERCGDHAIVDGDELARQRANAAGP
jgi:hypothetical protein